MNLVPTEAFPIYEISLYYVLIRKWLMRREKKNR